MSQGFLGNRFTNKEEDTKIEKGPDPESFTDPCYQQQLIYSYTCLNLLGSGINTT